MECLVADESLNVLVVKRISALFEYTVIGFWHSPVAKALSLSI